MDPGLPEGVLCNHPYPSVVRLSVGPSVFKYLRDSSKDFSNFLHEVSAPQGYKSNRARFSKKNIGHKWGKPTLGSFLIFFANAFGHQNSLKNIVPGV